MATSTLDHLLFSCPLAQSGIAWIQSLLFSAFPVAATICLRHIRFGFNPEELLCVPLVFIYFLHVMNVLVWWQRNDYRFHATHPSAVGLIATMKARVKFYLPLYFIHFVHCCELVFQKGHLYWLTFSVCCLPRFLLVFCLVLFCTCLPCNVLVGSGVRSPGDV